MVQAEVVELQVGVQVEVQAKGVESRVVGCSEHVAAGGADQETSLPVVVVVDKMVAGTGSSRSENRVERTGFEFDFDFDFDSIEDSSVDVAGYIVGVDVVGVEKAEEAEEAEETEEAEREPDIGIDVGSRGQAGVVVLDVVERKAGLGSEADIETDVD